MLLGVLCLLLVSLGPARAGELGHFGPGVMNIRDFLVPDPGFYYLQYFVWYNADTIRDRNGDKVNSINVGNTKLKVDTEVDSFVLAPAFVWVSPWKFLVARYAAQIVPTFGNTSVQAALRTETGFREDVDESQFAVGDLYLVERLVYFVEVEFFTTEKGAQRSAHTPTDR